MYYNLPTLDSTVSEDAGIELRTFGALPPEAGPDALTTRPDLFYCTYSYGLAVRRMLPTPSSH
jgi:hypothetical protein